MNTNNAINQEQLNDWKKEYGHIYKTTIGDVAIIWRKLRRKEYVETMTAETDSPDTKIFDRQDAIVKLCSLYPDDIEELIEQEAGISGAVADEIPMKSGFDISATEEL